MEPRQLLSSSGLFIAATGELNLLLGSKDNVRVSSVSGSVLVETSIGTGSYSPLLSFGSVNSASVQSLVIVGGDDSNTIDLNGVTAAAFTALTSISVDAANGHDSITGSLDLGDSIIGSHGDDTIDGQGGNDTIIGSDGNDSIIGGDGTDTILGGDGQDSITGDAGNDSVDAGNGDDTVSGGIDNDSISAGNGEDSLNGDAGDDTLNGDGGTDIVSGDDDNDSILGGEFGDSLLGGAGNDTINGQGGDDNIDGGDGDDSLKGGANNDIIIGGVGNDVLNGETGNDELNGEDGNDTAFGGSGNDSLNGGTGNDVLSGQAGNDNLVGGGDADSLNGGAGNDFLTSVSQSVSIVSSITIATEGNSGTSNASFLVNLSLPSASTVTVDFATQDGTATAGSDYQAVSGTLTFAPGVTSQTILVPIIGDTLDESDETFTVVLSNPTNVQLGPSSSTATITDDDAAPPALFDLQIVFSGGLTPSQQAIFTAAELQWESIITGDVPDVVVPGFGLIDDLQIDASGVPIDGAGGILGQAGPDFLRPGSSLPAHGRMQFDTADLASLEASGQLQDTILHEMAHVLGFGTIWSNLGLLLNPASQGGNNPRFTGVQATQEFNARFGQNAADVPVEAAGGQRTADGHWRDSIFNNELMTGFINTPGPNPLSRITIAQFADLGYQVNLTPADPYLAVPPSNGNSSGGLPRNNLIVTRPAMQVLPPSAVVPHPLLLATGGMGVTTTTLSRGADVNASLLASTQGEVAIAVNPTNPQNVVLMANGGTSDSGAQFIANSLDGGATWTIRPLGFAQDNSGSANSVRFDGALAFDRFGNLHVTYMTANFSNGNLAILYAISADGGSTFLPNVMISGGVSNQIRDVTDPGNDFGDYTGIAAYNDVAYPVWVDNSNSTGDNPGGNQTFEVYVDRVTLTTTGGSGGGGGTSIPAVGDTLVGGDGDDTIVGADGNDTISGQAGNDSLLGGAGDDSILGGAGQDTLDGQAGNDTLDGQGGSDTVFGGEGDDTFIFTPSGSGFETIDGGEGLNTAQALGTTGDDTITVGAVGSALSVSAGSSTLIVNGNLQNVIVDGLGGNDTITVTNISGVGFVQLSVNGGDGNDTLTAAGADIGSVRLSLNGNNGNDSLIGSNGNDTLDGGAGNDAANGGAGNDTIRGGIGNDQIGGGTGNDFIDGGDGNDFANGDAGNDNLLGGNGADTLKGADGADTLNGGAGNDNVNGMAGDDSVLGGVGKDVLAGGAGNDTLDGGRNDDTISGHSGNDLIRGDHGHDFIDAGDGNNTVNGGDGNDTILAADGLDLLNGGDGNDQINAGNGNDIVTGGDGNDSILGGGGADVILGGDGEDYIDGQGGTDTVAGNQGIDVLVDPLSEIDEQFVLSAAVLLALQAN